MAKVSTQTKRKQKGLCIYCGKVSPEPGKNGCTECREKVRLRNKSRRDRRVSKGLCSLCGDERLPDSRFCRRCFLTNVANKHTGSRTNWEPLLQKFYDQNERCALTGRKLILGVNAQLDHIRPRSRYPELAQDLENLQWVDSKVNLVKSDLTNEELIELCGEILKCQHHT